MPKATTDNYLTSCEVCGKEVEPWNLQVHSMWHHAGVVMVPGDSPGVIEIWSRKADWFDIPSSWMAL
jgi:hypothetical protein